MPDFRTILHPTDFSGLSEEAFRVACSLARASNGRLIVVHVAPMATVYGGIVPGVPTDPTVYQHALEKRLREIQPAECEPSKGPTMAEAASPRPGLLVEHRLREGDAAQEILQVAEEVDADLIVLGTHGRSGLSRLLMGSVAEAVLRDAPCAVITVKPAVAQYGLSRSIWSAPPLMTPP